MTRQGQPQLLGVLRDRIWVHPALDDLEPVHEAPDPGVLAPAYDALGLPVVEREEAEVPQAGACRGERPGLVDALVDLRPLDHRQAAYRVWVGRRVGIRDHGPDVVPDYVDLAGVADREQQLVDVLGGLVVARGGRPRHGRPPIGLRDPGSRPPQPVMIAMTT